MKFKNILKICENIRYVWILVDNPVVDRNIELYKFHLILMFIIVAKSCSFPSL